MKQYFILRREAPAAQPRSGMFGLLRRAPPEVSTNTAELTDREARDTADDPRTEAITPIMPTRLLQPVALRAAVAPAWGVEAVGADTSPYTGAATTVAVLDTGIDRDHAAVNGVELIEEDFSGDGNGDQHGHGTHCAGTIFGRDHQGMRIGIATGVERALIGKVLDSNGSGQSDWLFDAMLWAMRNRADVVSMSLGFDFAGMVADLIRSGWPAELATSTALEAYRANLKMFDAVMEVLRAHLPFGTSPLVIAAAGNESRRELDPKFKIAASLPAAAQGVVSVAAVEPDGQKYDVADFSNIFATLSAPGVDIVSAAPGGGLQSMSGTSMACPHVAGVAALWWDCLDTGGQRPTPTSVVARLLATARRDVLVSPDETDDVGEGLVFAPQQ